MKTKILILTMMGVTLPGLAPAGAHTQNPVSSPVSSKAGKPSSAKAVAKAERRTRQASPKAPDRTEPKSRNAGATYTGKASFYGGKWHGRLTANGETYNQNSMTAAHKTLPFNTRVRVTNLNNGKSVVLRINNRGPYIAGRIIDVSVAAAHQLGMVKSGVVPTKVEVL